jgi:hypothetical protein
MLRGLTGPEGARFQDAGDGHVRTYPRTNFTLVLKTCSLLQSIQTQTPAIAVRHANDNRAAVLAAARREKVPIYLRTEQILVNRSFSENVLCPLPSTNGFSVASRRSGSELFSMDPIRTATRSPSL